MESKHDVAKASFNNAHDGKEVEKQKPVVPTEQQQRAAEKLVEVSNKDKPNTMELKSAASALHFNVRAQDDLTQRPTAEVPKSPETYRSVTTGETFTGVQAVSAAKAADKATLEQQKADKQQKTEAQKKKHHAPAPKPLGVAADANRGRSVTPAPTASKKQINEKRCNAYEAQAIAIAEKKIAMENQQGKSKSSDKGVEL